MMGMANWLAQSGLYGRVGTPNPLGGLPRTSYGVPRPIQQIPVEGAPGPRGGFQRPVAEGYRPQTIPQGGKGVQNAFKDMGIRNQIGSALDMDALLPLISPNAYQVQ